MLADFDGDDSYVVMELPLACQRSSSISNLNKIARQRLNNQSLARKVTRKRTLRDYSKLIIR